MQKFDNAFQKIVLCRTMIPISFCTSPDHVTWLFRPEREEREKENWFSGLQTRCHLVLGPLGSDPPLRHEMALDFLADCCGSSTFQVDGSDSSILTGGWIQHHTSSAPQFSHRGEGFLTMSERPFSFPGFSINVINVKDGQGGEIQMNRNSLNFFLPWVLVHVFICLNPQYLDCLFIFIKLKSALASTFVFFTWQKARPKEMDAADSFQSMWNQGEQIW